MPGRTDTKSFYTEETANHVSGTNCKACDRAGPTLRREGDLVGSIAAVSFLDADRAVEMAFAQLLLHPSWDGFDQLAAFHSRARPLLDHPRVQEYYVKESKWIPYLAERVPEYAKYKAN